MAGITKGVEWPRRFPPLRGNGMASINQLDFVALLVVLLGSIAFAADGSEQAPAKLLSELEEGTAIEVTVTAPETGETKSIQRKLGVFDRLAFQNCFGVDGKGAITAAVRTTADGKTFTARTVGLAEDFYLLHILDIEEPFAKWLKKARDGVKNSPDVLVAAKRNSTVGEREIDPVPSSLLSAVAVAAMKYEEKRPELMLRVRRHSHLFFPRAGRARWTVHQNGERLFVRMACSDLMYFATFEVELRKVGDEWEYVQLHAQEAFKGE